MALTYNNVDPTTINYKGTDITVVKYGTTAVWGKHFTLSVSAGTGSTITVNRTSSPNQHASTGSLSNGATIYYGDVLTLNYNLGTAYNLSSFKANGTTITGGSSYTVTSDTTVATVTAVKSYSLSISAGTGSSITVNRTSSPYKGASTGNLSNGATIYYGDALTISYSVSSGYNIDTHTVNGTTFTSGSQYTVSSNISVVTTATYVPSWHTVLNTSTTFNFSVNSYGNTTITVSGLRANTQTRITGKVYKDADLTASGFGSGWWGRPTEYSFTNESTPYTKTGVYQYSPDAKLIQISTPTSANTFPIYRQSGDDSSVIAGCSKLILTKVEQYY